MPEFHALDPNAEVNGSSIISMIQAIGDKIIPVLEDHDLKDIDPDGWYPQQKYLDVFREIDQGTVSSMFDLVAIGTKIPQLVRTPPEVDTIAAIFSAMDQAYQMNHRGNAGNFQVEFVDGQHVKLVDTSPYPCHFQYGVFYGFAKRFCAPGEHFRVVHDDTQPCRRNGGTSCTYHITWGSA